MVVVIEMHRGWHKVVVVNVNVRHPFEWGGGKEEGDVTEMLRLSAKRHTKRKSESTNVTD